VNRERGAIRPLEQLPLERDRYALAARFARRVGRSTMRIEERLYMDSWALFASSTDGRYIRDLTSRFSAGPHVRAHIQSGTNFYNRVYESQQLSDGALVIPTFRTTDRELSPILSLTGGVWGKFDLAAPGKGTQYSFIFQGDVMFTHFFDALFITNRLAMYGTLAFEVNFE